MRTTESHFAFILAYQAEHGHGTRPPVAGNKVFSDWFVNRVRRFRARVGKKPELARNPPSDIVRLSMLGLLCLDPDSPRYVLASADPSRPRGLKQSARMLLERCASGRPPSLFSADVTERHLALWLLRISTGMVADKHAGVAIDATLQLVFDRIWASYAAPTNAAMVSREWSAFCARLLHLGTSGRFEKIDSWHRALVKLPAARVARPGKPAALGRDASGGAYAREPLLQHSASSIITYLNAALATSKRPFEFRCDRPATARFDAYLTELGYGLHQPMEFQPAAPRATRGTRKLPPARRSALADREFQATAAAA